MAWELAQGWIGLVSRRVATLAMQVSQLANGALNVGETGVSGTESLCAGGLAWPVPCVQASAGSLAKRFLCV